MGNINTGGSGKTPFVIYLVNLLKKDNMSIEELAETMPGKHIPSPDEIGLFVKFIVKNN